MTPLTLRQAVRHLEVCDIPYSLAAIRRAIWLKELSTQEHDEFPAYVTVDSDALETWALNQRAKDKRRKVASE